MMDTGADLLTGNFWTESVESIGTRFSDTLHALDPFVSLALQQIHFILWLVSIFTKWNRKLSTEEVN